MDIKIYTGGHQATTEHFIEVLKENKTALDAENIVCFPLEDNTFHSIFKASKAIQKGGNALSVQSDLMQQLTGVKDAKTLLITDNRVIDQEHRKFEKELFYPKPGGVIKQIKSIFNDFNLRLFVETRDFASLIPANYYNRLLCNVSSSFEDYVTQLNIDELRWSTLIDRVQGRGAQVPVTTWRYEDYPYVWRDIVGAITGIPRYQDLLAPFQELDLSVNLQAALLFYKYTQKYPAQSAAEFEKMKALFLEQNPKPSNKHIHPDWSQERVQALTYSYDDDWYYIERMGGVETILPRVHNHNQP